MLSNSSLRLISGALLLLPAAGKRGPVAGVNAVPREAAEGGVCLDPPAAGSGSAEAELLAEVNH